jgi:serine/threonine protein kinase/tetratricopeptide (TPR) repeat protein
MESDSWDRVQELFLAAADLSGPQRDQFLDTACTGEAQLRAEVESLLRADHRGAEAISAALADEAALMLETDSLDPENLDGERLGPYRVIREIGRGGMGVVYLAQRDDDQYHKQAAIKVVKRGMDTAEVLARFRSERQILANLDHPCIARLLDGGTTLDGRPFFVMELVEGQPADVFCNQNSLDIEARCRLFLRFLDPVAYAHRNLVVHRDLKPRNILVTPDGTPKLLDFGVAKLLSADAGGHLTTFVARPFTPEYASPEQVQGLPVTTATDVYALGAVLYEMLTGQRAQPVATLTPLEVHRAVCDTEITRPSVAVPGLDADLDNIVLMAMRKEPARRYHSVDQFADDIQRYLDRRPVLARQDSFAYRSGKFLRRNRLPIAAASAVFLSLVAGLVVSVAQSHRAEAARRASEVQREAAVFQFRRAETAREAEAQQRARAEQRTTELIELANRTLFDVDDSIQSLPGAVSARRTIVRTTLDYLEGLQQDIGLDDRMRMVLSAAYYKIGIIQGAPTSSSLGDYPAAEESVRKSEALLEPLHQQNNRDPDNGDPAVMLSWLQLEGFLADLAFRSGHNQAAVAANLKLLPEARKLGQLRPSDLPSSIQEAETYSRLVAAIRADDPARARQYEDSYVASVRALLARFPTDIDLKREYGSALAASAGLLRGAGDLEKSAGAYLESIHLREELLGADPHNSKIRRDLLVANGNYAMVLGIPWAANLGRFDEARAAAAQAVALGRELVAADPEDATARYDLANALARFGMVETGPENIPAALASLEEAIGMMETMMKANPTAITVATQLTLAREYAGHRLERLGQTAAAARQYRQSLDEATALSSSGGFALALQALVDEEALALLDASTGERAEALEFAHRAVAHAEKYAAGTPPPDDRAGHLGMACFVLASVQKTFGDWEPARQAAERALSIWRPIRNPGVLTLHHQAIQGAEALLRESVK